VCLIKNGYPRRAHLSQCILKYLNKKHQVTYTLLPHLGEISYEVRGGIQRFAHRYLLVQLQFAHKNNTLKKSLSHKDKQKNLRRSNVVHKSNLHRWTHLHWTNMPKVGNAESTKHKFDQRSEIYKHMLANPMHRLNATRDIGKHSRSIEASTRLLIQYHQLDFNADSTSIPLLLLSTHNDLHHLI